MRVHELPESAIHVFEHSGNVFARTPKTVYRLKKVGGTDWEEVKEGRNLVEPFATMTDRGLFGLSLKPSEVKLQSKSQAELVPKGELHSSSLVKSQSNLFISSTGRIFEFEIRDWYHVNLSSMSVRTILRDPYISLVGTYGGIYVGAKRLESPAFTNGYATRVGSRVFLAAHDLYMMELPDTAPSVGEKDANTNENPGEPASFTLIKTFENTFLGEYRKVLAYDDSTIIALRSHSVELLDDAFRSRTLASEKDFTDLEPIGDGFLATTLSGGILWIRKGQVTELLDSSHDWQDAAIVRDRVYLASFNGIFKARLSTVNGIPTLTDPELIADLPYSVMVAVETNGNIWASTYSALYVIKENDDQAGTYWSVPIVENVEFNRRAMHIQNSILYAGSTQGEYQVSLGYVSELLLPTLLDGITVSERPTVSTWLLPLMLLLLPASGMIMYLFYRKSRRQQKLLNLIRATSKRAIPLEEMNFSDFEQAIRDHEHILTVRDMTDHYETNAMQLNRVFNRLGTTPGRFLKEVKLKIAMDMVQDGRTISAIQKRTGYSQRFLKEELPKAV